MEKDLNKNVAQATKWSSVTELGSKLIAPLTNAILARLLIPEVFGVVATLTLVVSFAEIFTDAGFQKYLVQHQFESEDELNKSTNVAFWTNLILSVAIWGVIALMVTPIADMVGASGYESAIVLMSAEIPLLAFSSIQMARYRREFDYKNLFVARMAVSMVPLVVTVPAALIFRSHWALVIGTLARDVLNAVILTVRSKWKPRFYYSFAKLKEMLSFSLWTIVENITIWLSSNIDIFIVGTILSAYYLGIYKTTIATANSYMGIITSATTPVLFAALSRCQDHDGDFREVFFRFQRMVALLVLPLGFGVFVFRELATSILLGSQWTETADFLGMWFLSGAVTIVFSNYNSEAFRSKGKPKLSILVQLIYLLVLVPALLMTVRESYETLTVARTLTRFVIIIASMGVMQFSLRIRAVEIVKNTLPQLVSALVMSAAGTALLRISRNVVWQLFSVGLCVLVYGGTMLILPAGRRTLAEIPILRKILRLDKYCRE